MKWCKQKYTALRNVLLLFLLLLLLLVLLFLIIIVVVVVVVAVVNCSSGSFIISISIFISNSIDRPNWPSLWPLHLIFIMISSIYTLGMKSQNILHSTWNRKVLICTGMTWLCSNITKTRLYKYIENFTSKNWKISDKNSDIFRIFPQNIDCGYSLEPPRRGGSNEYPKSMFLTKIRKIMYTPVHPGFYYTKVGFKGVKIIQACFRDDMIKY